MKRLVIDIDGTLTTADTPDYQAVSPNLDVVASLNGYKAQGFEIVLYTSRNMRTHDSNVGKITAHTVPVITAWLAKHAIPYDELWVGKPWCGNEGFYVDDKAVRPDEFARLTYAEICDLIGIKDKSGG